jgi:cytochrome c oxidase subunit 2
MHSIFNPASPEAAAVTRLWWWMFGAGLTIWLGVAAIAVRAGMKKRATDDGDEIVRDNPSAARHMERILIAGVLGTGIVLAAVLTYSFTVGRALAQHPAQRLLIEVTGHRWWWEVRYASADPTKLATTANEIHVPVGVPVQVQLHSDDVIHSFWVPNLNGKRDLVPGHASSLWFRADTPGVYRGQCAEFCGIEHAKMAFFVVAQPRAAFDAWLAETRRPAITPADSAARTGEEVFVRNGCPLCHAIAGTDAGGEAAPNLTHVASRGTIAAGVLANTPDNVARWIFDPSVVKPGALMPAFHLPAPDMQALVAYLETLR